MRRTLEYGIHGRVARWFRSRKPHGWSAVTLPLPFVTVILYWLTDDEMTPNPVFVVHENEHAEQAARYGWIGFWIRYVWGMRKGYRNNPLEQQAREVAGQE